MFALILWTLIGFLTQPFLTLAYESSDVRLAQVRNAMQTTGFDILYYMDDDGVLDAVMHECLALSIRGFKFQCVKYEEPDNPAQKLIRLYILSSGTRRLYGEKEVKDEFRGVLRRALWSMAEIISLCQKSLAKTKCIPSGMRVVIGDCGLPTDVLVIPDDEEATRLYDNALGNTVRRTLLKTSAGFKYDNPTEAFDKQICAACNAKNQDGYSFQCYPGEVSSTAQAPPFQPGHFQVLIVGATSRRLTDEKALRDEFSRILNLGVADLVGMIAKCSPPLDTEECRRVADRNPQAVLAITDARPPVDALMPDNAEAMKLFHLVDGGATTLTSTRAPIEGLPTSSPESGTIVFPSTLLAYLFTTIGLAFGCLFH